MNTTNIILRELRLFLKYSLCCGMVIIFITGCTTRNNEQNPLIPESLSTEARGLVLINEIYINGNPDWIELCNKSHRDIDLKGWGLSDDAANISKTLFPESCVLPAGDFQVFDLVDFSLNDTGEEIVLSLPDGSPADHKVFGEIGEKWSLGRFPDGTNNWDLMLPTPGSSNGSRN
ncbi:MAG: lamin tail domain-containing protein [Candidatus Electryonea clarkiae]|nr:lamin tail domain-containing protein [Candidatus Electryonea clarkiae]MDP8287712.1 lamin tail domain-containing protein [Candidatus Electryonea clarkiae]